MPRSSEINIHVHGHAAHGTAPCKGKDALYIGASLLRKIYEKHAMMPGAVSHFPPGKSDLPIPAESSPDEKTIIHIGKMTSGYARNIVSDYTHMLGTVRAFSDDKFREIISLLKSCILEMREQYDCEIDFSNSEGYPPVVNEPELYGEMLPVLRSMECGYEEFDEPLMISEDFSFYGKYAPSLFFLLGTGTGIPLHSVNFDFDEDVLTSGFLLYKNILEKM